MNDDNMIHDTRLLYHQACARCSAQSLFGWAGPEILVQPRKYSCFSTAESGGSYASANDHRLAKVM
jgi:hypothetical protein